MTNQPQKADGDSLMDRFRRYMRDHNFPVTQQREAVASTIFYSKSHLSVDDIETSLRSEGEHVGTATVYRTLELLSKAGLIEEHDFGEGFKRYESKNKHGDHAHIICMECGAVVEFTSERLERMNFLVAEEHGFRHHHHRLEIYGVCRDCQQRDTAILERQPGTSQKAQ